MLLPDLFPENFSLTGKHEDLEEDIELDMTKICIKCQASLNKNNWNISCRKRKRYICKICHASKCKAGRDLIKNEIIRHYGSVCVCCQEDNVIFLSLDHIDGNGAKHRKFIGKLSGSNFYRWLKKENYPKENYQVLCFNCNWAKHILGVCPHQSAR